MMTSAVRWTARSKKSARQGRGYQVGPPALGYSGGISSLPCTSMATQAPIVSYRAAPMPPRSSRRAPERAGSIAARLALDPIALGPRGAIMPA